MLNFHVLFKRHRKLEPESLYIALSEGKTHSLIWSPNTSKSDNLGKIYSSFFLTSIMRMCLVVFPSLKMIYNNVAIISCVLKRRQLLRPSINVTAVTGMFENSQLKKHLSPCLFNTLKISAEVWLILVICLVISRSFDLLKTEVTGLEHVNI